MLLSRRTSLAVTNIIECSLSATVHDQALEWPAPSKKFQPWHVRPRQTPISALRYWITEICLLRQALSFMVEGSLDLSFEESWCRVYLSLPAAYRC